MSLPRPVIASFACLPFLALATIALAQTPPLVLAPLVELATNDPGSEPTEEDKQSTRKAVVTSQPFAAAASRVLFRDDFSGTKFDSRKWTVGTWMLGRTQLGNVPTVADGFARLKFDTFNPANSSTFRGTEIGTKAAFALGNGLEFEARVRVNAMPNGLVTSLFTYVSRQQSGITYSDEIDFEFLSSQINRSTTSDPVLTTTWNNWNNNVPVYENTPTYYSSSTEIDGLNLSDFHTLIIRWLPGSVEWLIDGNRIHYTTSAVPNERTNIRLNFWAPASGWSDAYSSDLVPAKSSQDNRSFYYDVDYVEVRSIP